jgi:hypothetical protein
MGSNAKSQLQFLGCVSLALGALFPACSAAPPEGDETVRPEALSSCSFAVTQNVYDGPNYWGTITIKNEGSSNVTGFAVSFSIPSGDHCTNDAVPSGATLSPLTGSGSSAHTVSNFCKYTWGSATLAAGASYTFNYSTDNTNFRAATGVSVTSSNCSTGGVDAGTGKDGSSTDSGSNDTGTSKDSGAVKDSGDAAVACGSTGGTPIWTGNPSKGTSVFKILDFQPSGIGSISVISDRLCGPSFQFSKPSTSKRVEAHGASGFTAQDGELVYIGWRAKLTIPSGTNTNAIFQWKAYDKPGSTTPLQQNFPIILSTYQNNVALAYYAPGEVRHQIWSTPLVAGEWYTFVLGIKVSTDPAVGYIEFWYNGQQQTLAGSLKYPARTRDGDYCDPKWGVYGALGTDVVDDVCDLAIASAANVAQPCPVELR